MPRAQRVAVVENAAVAHDQMDHRGHPGKLVEYGVTYRDTSVLKGLLDPSSARKDCLRESRWHRGIVRP